MMSVLCVAIFWVVNTSSGEKSCLQFSIPTGSEAGGEGGVSHRLKGFHSNRRKLVVRINCKFQRYVGRSESCPFRFVLVVTK